MRQAIQQLQTMGITPDSYNVSALSLKATASEPKVQPEESDLPASQWHERYQKNMIGV
jgi:hypothetical protein